MPRRIREFALQIHPGGAGAAAAAGGPAGGGGGPVIPAAAAAAAAQPDGYLDKVVKYVPADVIAAWTAAVAIIQGAVGIPTSTVLLICFVVGLGLTFWWTLAQTDAPGQPPAYKQAGIATCAFLVWVLALGDLDTALGTLSFMTWNAAYAKLLLIAFTAVSGKL
jgi:hypothetical protein